MLKFWIKISSGIKIHSSLLVFYRSGSRISLTLVTMIATIRVNSSTILKCTDYSLSSMFLLMTSQMMTEAVSLSVLQHKHLVCLSWEIGRGGGGRGGGEYIARGQTFKNSSSSVA